MRRPALPWAVRPCVDKPRPEEDGDGGSGNAAEPRVQEGAEGRVGQAEAERRGEAEGGAGDERPPGAPGSAQAVPTPRRGGARSPARLLFSTERTPWRPGARPAGAAAASPTSWGTRRRTSATPCAASTRPRPAPARRTWPWRPAPPPRPPPARRARRRSTSRSRAPSPPAAPPRGRGRARTGCWCERAALGCAPAGSGARGSRLAAGDALRPRGG